MLQRCVYVCIIIYIYGRIRELKSLYHFRFSRWFFYYVYIYYIYIYSFIYNIFRRLLPTVPSVVISLRFPWSFMWSSNFRHGLLKSLLSKYTLFSILYHLCHSFLPHSRFKTQAYEHLPTERVFPPTYSRQNIDIILQDIIDVNVTRSFILTIP